MDLGGAGRVGHPGQQRAGGEPAGLEADAAPTRQYSLCGDPADHHVWRLGILRDAGGGGSRFVHDRLRAGDTVRVRGPRNNFELLDSPRYLFIAGGMRGSDRSLTGWLPKIRRIAPSAAAFR